MPMPIKGTPKQVAGGGGEQHRGLLTDREGGWIQPQ
jgi:hypothetical protein